MLNMLEVEIIPSGQIARGNWDCWYDPIVRSSDVQVSSLITAVFNPMNQKFVVEKDRHRQPHVVSWLLANLASLKCCKDLCRKHSSPDNDSKPFDEFPQVWVWNGFICKVLLSWFLIFLPSSFSTSWQMRNLRQICPSVPNTVTCAFVQQSLYCQSHDTLVFKSPIVRVMWIFDAFKKSPSWSQR